MSIECSARKLILGRRFRAGRGIFSRLALMLMVPLAAGIVAMPASAQFSKAYKFLEAVRKQDGQTVQDNLSEPGSVIVNTRDVTSGDTALIIVTRRRDQTWMSFLLGKGADPNIHNNHDETPLTIAAALGFSEGVTLLLQTGAHADEPNATGETPLMSAVMRRDLPIIRALLGGGANPDRTDSAGRSARDYAAHYGKDSAIAMALNAAATAKSARTTYGPTP